MIADARVRKLLLLVIVSSLAAGASALTICVAPAEGKPYAPAPEGSGSPLGYIVTGCMTGLFDAGHIATDASPVRVARADWGSACYGLSEAKEGQVDFVIALYAEWTTSAFHKDVLVPASVEYRLVRVIDGKVLDEGVAPAIADSEDAASHEARTASQAGASAALACIGKLSALVTGGE